MEELLTFVPTTPASAEPTDNYHVWKAAMLLERTHPGPLNAKGVRHCANGCDAESDNNQHILPGNLVVTHAMAAHLLRWHDAEVSSNEKAHLGALFDEHFPGFDYDAFDADTERKAELIASIPTPRDRG